MAEQTMKSENRGELTLMLLAALLIGDASWWTGHLMYRM